jgi:hypothetical protein
MFFLFTEISSRENSETTDASIRLKPVLVAEEINSSDGFFKSWSNTDPTVLEAYVGVLHICNSSPELTVLCLDASIKDRRCDIELGLSSEWVERSIM